MTRIPGSRDDNEAAAEQLRRQKLEASEAVARQQDRSFAVNHRDGDPPPAAKG
jgi:hypothetical protein